MVTIVTAVLAGMFALLPTLLVSGRRRALRMLKDEAETAAVMPDGDAKQRMLEVLADNAAEYQELAGKPKPPYWVFAAAAVSYVVGTGAFYVLKYADHFPLPRYARGDFRDLVTALGIFAAALYVVAWIRMVKFGYQVGRSSSPLRLPLWLYRLQFRRRLRRRRAVAGN